MKQQYKTDLSTKDPFYWRKPPQRFYLMKDHPKKVVFPAYLPPKFDGILAECVLNLKTNKSEIVSRQLEVFTNAPKHLKELKGIHKKYPNLILFGEFYQHGLRLQEISGMARRTDQVNKLTLYVFDAVLTDKPNMIFKKRRALLMKIFDEEFPDLKYIVRMKMPKVNNKKELEAKYKSYLKKGYEGAMYYNPAGIYRFYYTTSRTPFVLKMKPRRSAEFKVVGFKDGNGKNKGLVVFIMETEDGVKFNAQPNLTEDVRRKLFKKFQKYFHYENKYATITYSELSEKGVPQQPKFIALRDPSDN